MMNNQQNQAPFVFNPSAATSSISSDDDEESKMWKKVKESPVLPVATLGFLGIAGYRVYKARSRGGINLSMFLIHTRLAAQGFGVAVLGSLVLYSLGQRLYNNVFTSENNNQKDS